MSESETPRERAGAQEQGDLLASGADDVAPEATAHDESGDDDASDVQHARADDDWQIAPKEYYSMGEVCDLVGLKPHVLRYWESQFPVLNPSKNRSGNRVFQKKEIKLILLVKHLLYNEKFTVEGARQRMEQLRRTGELRPAAADALEPETLALLRRELAELGDLLTLPPRDA